MQTRIFLLLGLSVQEALRSSAHSGQDGPARGSVPCDRTEAAEGLPLPTVLFGAAQQRGVAGEVHLCAPLHCTASPGMLRGKNCLSGTIKAFFSPGKFPLLPRSSPALCFSLLPSSWQAGRRARAEHPGRFGHTGQACGLRLATAVPRRCSARCPAGATGVAPPSKFQAKFKHCLLA